MHAIYYDKNEQISAIIVLLVNQKIKYRAVFTIGRIIFDTSWSKGKNYAWPSRTVRKQLRIFNRNNFQELICTSQLKTFYKLQTVFYLIHF